MNRHRTPIILATAALGLIGAITATAQPAAETRRAPASPAVGIGDVQSPTTRVSAERVIAVALARVPQGILVAIDRPSRATGTWDVDVATPAGEHHEIRINAAGRVVRAEIDDDRWTVTPLPPGAVSATRAGAIAVAHVRGGVADEIERSNRPGVTWRVDVDKGRDDYTVDVAANGRVVRSVIDD